MKRTLSIILCLVMVLSLVVVTISAAPKADEVGKVASGYTPEGTGIDSLSQITDPAGKYYLTKDITVTESYKTEFTGTFDGNGKTITASVALFERVRNATVMNFVVKGSINLTEPGFVPYYNAETDKRKEDFYAAVAIAADGKSTFKNILSDVDMATTSENTRIAAIVGSSDVGYDLVIDTCVNKGDISVVKYAGGIYGWTAQDGKGVVTNCANYGKITSTGGYIAGIVNRMGGELPEGTAYKLEDVYLKITDCANYGEVESTGGNASGILAYHNESNLTITGCVNEGKINAVGGAGAGISASPSVGEEGVTVIIKDCVNKGAIFAKSQMGGIVAYANTKDGKIFIEDCVNEGDITGLGTSAYGAGIIGRAGHNDATAKDSSITVKNCVNKGDILVGKDQGGGMMGYDCMKTSTYDGCKNYGKISYIEGANRSQAAGIFGNHRQGAGNKLIVKNCENFGEIVALDHNAGGIVATSNVLAEITNCVNHGNVSSVYTATANTNVGGIAGNIANPGASNRGINKVTMCANYGDVTTDTRAGGIVSYAWGAVSEVEAERTWIEVTNCINAGKITAKAMASQLMTYTNADYTVIKNNLAVGSVVADGDAALDVFVAGSTANLAAYTISGNYYAEGTTPKYFTYTATEENVANTVELANAPAGAVVSAAKAQLSSGEVAYKLNTAIGKDVFKQDLGSDAAPSFDGKTVLKNTDGTFSNPASTPSAPTGDVSVIVLAIAILTLGTAVVIGKKVSVR